MDDYTFPSGAPRARPIPKWHKFIVPPIRPCGRCGKRHGSTWNCDGSSIFGKRYRGHRERQNET